MSFTRLKTDINGGFPLVLDSLIVNCNPKVHTAQPVGYKLCFVTLLFEVINWWMSFGGRRTEAWFALGIVARGKVASHGLLRINLGVTVVCKQANGLRQPSAGGRALVRPAGKALERIPARKMPLIPASRLHAMLARCIIELPLLKTK